MYIVCTFLALKAHSLGVLLLVGFVYNQNAVIMQSKCSQNPVQMQSKYNENCLRISFSEYEKEHVHTNGLSIWLKMAEFRFPRKEFRKIDTSNTKSETTLTECKKVSMSQLRN